MPTISADQRTPFQRSKRGKAVEHIHSAEYHIREALSLLGGHPKVKFPKKDHMTFIVRRMLESILLRLKTCFAILTHPHNIARIIDLDSQAKTDVALLSDFEREYDSTRRPGC